MRTILFLALCVGALTAVGIIHFRKSGDKVNVSIDTGELKEKTEELIDAVKDTLSGEDDDRASGQFNDLMDNVRDTIDAAEDAGSGLLQHGRRTHHESPW